MSELGVFAVDRGVFDHPLLDEGAPYSKREAWLWLIKEASWKSRPYGIAGQVIQLQRGQLAHSVRFMAAAWKWHRARVERFLDRLKTETMIETATETGLTVISICKFDAYQRVGLPERDTIRDTERDSSETPARQTRNNKTLNDIPLTPKGAKGGRKVDERYEDRFDPLYADFVAGIWAKRWKRKGHEPLPAFRAYAKLTDQQRLACKAAIERVGRAIEATASEERFRPLLASWINKHGWEADAGEASSGASEPDWAKWVAAFRADQIWNPVALGPEPGQPNCRVPRHLLVGIAAA